MRPPQAPDSDLAGRLQHTLAERRLDMFKKLENKSLDLPLPADGKAELRKAIEAHNKRAQTFETTRAKVERDIIANASDLLEKSGEQLADTAAQMRIRRYDSAAEHIACLKARRALIDDVIHAFEDGELAVATKALTKATSETKKLLEKSGANLIPNKGAAPHAAERAMEFAIRNADPVRKAQATVDAVNEELDKLRRERHYADSDIEWLKVELTRSWRHIVGDL